MFIPRYWSEASHLERYPNRKQVTVRRFGWSSESQHEADVHARQRVEDALAVLRDGGPGALRTFTRRERRVAYAGADGLPIREEIVEEHPGADVVVTRNSYGALCLNTTRAMFVDIDEPGTRAELLGCTGFSVGAAGGAVFSLVNGASPFMGAFWATVLLAAFVCSGLTWVVARVVERRDPRRKDLLAWVIGRVELWCERHPEWRVCAYETPAGVRLLPVHAAFDAGEASSFEFMGFVKADPLYERMCKLQKCFRARVSPKPWRAGMQDRFRAGGTWPVRDAAKLARREAWVQQYDERSAGFASCRLAETIGRGRADPSVEQVRHLHDEMCQAESSSVLA